MESVIIRQATVNDLQTLLLFEQGVIEAERPFDITLKMVDTNYYDIPKMISSHEVQLLVAEENDQLIGSGYARIESAKPYLQHIQHAYLGFMYVLPQYRGLGINKMIMDDLASWTLSQNINELRLDVYHINEPAIRAYEKFGFTRHMVEMRKRIG
ncbi:MAG: GNAT family N-acetyltransferase [Ferruginibacter sp.]